jgi:hypothetical protein
MVKKFFKAKPRINKTNKQINISLPKKQISLKDLDKIVAGKQIKFFMEIDDE